MAIRMSGSELVRTRPLIVAGAVGMTGYLALLIGYATRFAPEVDSDNAVLDALSPHAVPHSSWVATFQAISTVFGPAAFRVVAVTAIVLALVRRRSGAVPLLVTIGILLGGLVANLAKFLVNRPRPVQAVVHEFGSSYPSGHAFGVTVGVACLLIIGWPHLTGARRWAAAGFGVAVVLLVGFARLALSVHHLSDVLGGYGLGIAWTAVALIATRAIMTVIPSRWAGDTPSARDIPLGP